MMKTKILVIALIGFGSVISAQDQIINGNLTVNGDISGNYIRTTDGNATGAIFTYEGNQDLYIGSGKDSEGNKNNITLYNYNCSGGCNVPKISLLADEVYAPGNVGIGTNNPLSKLHINSDVARETFRLYHNGNTTKYLNAWQGSAAGVIDPIGTGLLYIGYDEPTDVLIGVNADGSVSSGKLGIGTTNPTAKLQVKTEDSGLFFNDWSGAAALHIDGADGDGVGGDYATLRQDGSNFDIYNHGHVIRINSLGNVGIGTTNPDVKLAVKGDIHTQEVRVDLNGSVAPDFVFEPDYDLRTLAETEAYIKANKHLPEIPSAAEMEENGIELKAMNLKLLQKVEELTLYVIDLQKQIDKLKNNKE